MNQAFKYRLSIQTQSSMEFFRLLCVVVKPLTGPMGIIINSMEPMPNLHTAHCYTFTAE